MTWEIRVGDVMDRLREIPNESVQCCVTSPPYWGLRDYGVSGQIGLEDTPDEHVARLVEVFREVRRVLRGDGTLWVNYGDTYAANRGGSVPPAQSVHAGDRRGKPSERNLSRDPKCHGLKHKDLIGLPWMLAFALRADGWWLRSDIVWSKPNPMPESVRDRPTRSHEYLFLLTKAARYYYDAEAVREDPKPWAGGRLNGAPDAARGRVGAEGYKQNERRYDEIKGANARSVWTINPQPFAEAHFATFPEALPERCIKAGSRRGDVVLDPFAGSGTTLLVAERLGRDSIGIELNPEYAAIARRRIAKADPMSPQIVGDQKTQGTLFQKQEITSKRPLDPSGSTA